MSLVCYCYWGLAAAVPKATGSAGSAANHLLAAAVVLLLAGAEFTQGPASLRV